MSLLIDALKKAEAKPLGGLPAGRAAWMSTPGNIATSLGMSRPMGLVVLAAVVFLAGYFTYVYFAMKGPTNTLLASLAPKPATSTPAAPAANPPPAAPVLSQPPQATEPQRPAAPADSAPLLRTPDSPQPGRAAVPATDSNALVAQASNKIRVMPEDRSAAYASPQILQAYQAWQNGRLSEAESLYQTALQQQPANTDALLGLAAIASQRNQPDQAVRYYSKVLQLDPNNPTAQAGLINLADAADPLSAGTRLKQLSAANPSNAALQYALGNHYSRLGNWQNAEQAYYTAFQNALHNPDYAFNLAVSLEHLDQPKEALKYYQTALQLANTRGAASFDRAQAESRIQTLGATLQEK